MHSHLISKLANEELLTLSIDVADAYLLSIVNDDGPPPQFYLYLLALCNQERVVRKLRARRTSHSSKAAAGQRQPRQRRVVRPGKTATGASSH